MGSSGRWRRNFEQVEAESQSSVYAEPVAADGELLFDDDGDLVYVLREVSEEG